MRHNSVNYIVSKFVKKDFTYFRKHYIPLSQCGVRFTESPLFKHTVVLK